MSGLGDLEITLRWVLEALSGLKIKYHLTGGVVASLYGEPRFTQDIDIVISLEGRQELIPNLLATLAAKFLIDPDLVRRAIAQGDMFQALDTEHFIKIDFHVGEAVPGELARTAIKELLPGLFAPLVTKEDAILSKLLWIKKGSAKSRQDVIMMLRGPDAVDWEVLRHRAAGLGIENLLAELRHESSNG